MFPYYWGGSPAIGGIGNTLGFFAGRDLEQDLPEEVRAAIEEHREEIHSEADLRRMAEELMLRR